MINHFDKWISVVANCILLCSFLFFSAVVTHTRFRVNGPASTPSHPHISLLEGEKVPLPGLESRKTYKLVLFLSPTCPYSNMQVDLFRTIERLFDTPEKHIFELAVAFRESNEAVHRWLRANSLQIGPFTDVDFQQLGIRQTPTIVVLDSENAVIRLWSGILDSHSREDLEMMVVQVVSRPAPKSPAEISATQIP